MSDIGQGDFVLHEQGLVRGRVAAVLQARVDQGLVAPLAAHGELVAAQLEAGVAVEHVVRHVLRPCGRHAVAGRVGDVDFAAVGAHAAAPLVEAPFPAHMGLRAVDIVGAAVGALGGGGGVVEAALVVARPTGLQGLLRREREAGAQATGLRMVALDLGDARVLAVRHRRGVRDLAIHAQREALAHRPGGEHRGLARGLALARAGGVAARDADRADPAVLGLARHHVDHAAQRLGTVERRHGAANDLDALDGRHGQPAVLVVGVAHHVVGRADAPAVDEGERVLAFQAAQRQRLAAAHLARREREAGRAAHGVEQIGGVARLQLLAADHGDAGGRGARVLLGQRGGDGDGGQRRGGGLCQQLGRRGGLGPRLRARQQQQRGQGHGAARQDATGERTGNVKNHGEKLLSRKNQ
jgi:hypothetical protein